MKPTIIFFGSFLEYSTQIASQLHQSPDVNLLGIVTTPPKPAGRKQALTKTHTHTWAQSQNLPVFTPENLTPQSLHQFENWLLKLDHSTKKSIDFFVVAGYGKLLPSNWLKYPNIAALNVHFSLLPKYRGAMPGEWALLMGETVTGDTLIEMSPEFDSGNIISQSKVDISPDETRESLYQKLYQLGGELTLQTLPHYLKFKTHPGMKFPGIDHPGIKFHLPPKKQPTKSPPPYARMIKKDETYIPWELVQKATQGEKITPSTQHPSLIQEIIKYSTHYTSYSILLHQAIRALHGWPGVWTQVNTQKGQKRLKIHSSTLENNRLILNQVQLEGETTTTFKQIQSQIS